MASQEFHQHLTGAVIGSGGGGEKASETEKTKSQKNAQKTRRVPTVSCTLCWHAFDLKTPCS